jgi:hypothetical protein
MGHGWLPIVLLLVAILHSPAYADPTNIGFADPSPASLSPGSSGELEFNALLKNTGARGSATVTLLHDKQCPRGEVTPKELDVLDMNAVVPKTFTISDIYKLPATCYIELISAGTNGNTALKQVKLNQVYAKSGVLVALAVCMILSVAAVLVGFTVIRDISNKTEVRPADCTIHPPGEHRACRRVVGLRFHLGTPAWDFAKSWTSTTTLVGGFISTALALGTLPELTQYASKTGYAILALVVSLVAVVAPFVFTVFRTGNVERDPKTGVYSVTYYGWVLPFLVSSSMTLFAGLAQLVVFYLLLHEVFRGYRFWSYGPNLAPVSWNLGAVLGTLTIMVLWGYAAYSVYLTIRLQYDADTMAPPAAPVGQNSFVGPLLQTPIKPRLLPWTVM